MQDTFIYMYQGGCCPEKQPATKWKRIVKEFFGQKKKWQNNSTSALKLSLVLLLTDNFLSFKLGAVFEYIKQMLLPLWRAKNDIIWGAWGRQFGIRKENDHVV